MTLFLFECYDLHVGNWGRIAFLFLGVFGGFPAQAGELNPVFTQLKPYRTYFILKGHRPIQTHFDVYFLHAGERRRLSIAGDTVGEIADMTSEQILGELVSGPSVQMPILHTEANPGSIKPLEVALRQLVIRDFADAQDIQIDHRGRFGTVVVQEIIPTQVGQTTSELLGFSSSAEYLYREGEKNLVLLKSTRYGDWGSDFIQDPAERPTFIPFQLPEILQGKSLLVTHDAAVAESRYAILGHWHAFEASVMDTLNALDGDYYVNPIRGILTDQGASALPKYFSQQIYFSFKVIARHPNPVFETEDTVNLEFPVNLAADVLASAEVSLPLYRLKIHGVLRFSDTAFLQLTITDSNGFKRQMRLSVRGPLLGVQNDLRFAIPAPLTRRVMGGQDEVIRLPGVRDYTSIEIHLGEFRPKIEIAPVECNFNLNPRRFR